MILATDKIPFPVHLDDTMIAAFRSCPTYWYWSYLRNLRPNGETALDLVAGGTYATGLEVARKLFWGGSDLSVEEIIHRARVAAIKKWGDYPIPENSPKSLPNILLALEDYFKHWGVATDPLQPVMYNGPDGSVLPAIEFSFALPIGINHPDTGEPILYTGKCDYIGQRQGSLWIVDDKTSSQLGPNWFTSWDMRSQFTGYVWAGRESNLTVAGVCVRGCAFTQTGWKFAEAITTRPQFMVDRWLADTRETIALMMQSWKTQQFPQEQGQACNAYNRPCKYQNLCTKENPEVWVPNNYHQFIWNPLEEGI